jgi:hypothetical protein
MRFAVIEGRMNSDKFMEFLKSLQADAGNPCIVSAENASHHSSGKGQKCARQSPAGQALRR